MLHPLWKLEISRKMFVLLGSDRSEIPFPNFLDQLPHFAVSHRLAVKMFLHFEEGEDADEEIENLEEKMVSIPILMLLGVLYCRSNRA